MRQARLTTIATAALALVAVWLTAMPTQAAPGSGNGHAEQLRVMSYNIRYDNGSATHAWADRLPLMADRLQQLQPDVLGVQEALDHQMTDLSTALPGYDWVGQGREGGTEGEYMGLFYKKDRLRLKESGDFWLSDTPSVPGSTSWGNTIPRMVTWALFQDKSGGRPFYVYNTHFDCDSACGNSDGNYTRLKMAELIAKRARNLRHPVLLTGDFNDAAGASDSYSHLTGKGRFGDTWEESGKRGPIVGTFNNYGPIQLGGNRIDWILRKGAVRTLEVRIDTYGQDTGDFASDHLPVVADVVVGQRPTGPVDDATPPDQVTGLTATAADDANMVSLSWDAGADNIGVESYDIYASTDPNAAPSEETLLANVPTLEFRHHNLGLGETWHYRVAAVDRLGNVGDASEQVSATTDPNKIMFEAEDGVPLIDGSAEARSQANCCGLEWSNGHQLLVLSSQVGDTAAFTVDMPTAGAFALTVDATTAGDFATWTLAIDGVQVGSPVDAYSSTIQLRKGIELGAVDLEAGEHVITFTVDGHNAESADYRMGIDALHLTRSE